LTRKGRAGSNPAIGTEILSGKRLLDLIEKPFSRFEDEERFSSRKIRCGKSSSRHCKGVPETRSRKIWIESKCFQIVLAEPHERAGSLGTEHDPHSLELERCYCGLDSGPNGQGSSKLRDSELYVLGPISNQFLSAFEMFVSRLSLNSFNAAGVVQT
jgi:hypothetical protein